MQPEVKELWCKCLEIIKSDLSDQSYSTWFAPIVPLKFSNNTLTIQVPSQFFYEWLEAVSYTHLTLPTKRIV